jgi:hypothetical protein
LHDVQVGGGFQLLAHNDELAGQIAAATIAADSAQRGQTIHLQDLPNLYPSQMPRAAPMVLVNKEVKEIALTPKRQGTYPPTIEPTTIPNMISFLDGIIIPIVGCPRRSRLPISRSWQ